MKYFPLLALALLSCAPLLTYNVPTAGSLEDIGFWISQNIDDDDNGKVDAPDVTAETRRGNCIDKALLCLAMARQGLGIEGEVVFPTATTPRPVLMGLSTDISRGAARSAGRSATGTRWG